jgi:hypothetical protein
MTGIAGTYALFTSRCVRAVYHPVIIVTGNITELHAARATGVIEGEDGKLYGFRGRDLRDCWFHDLVVGAIVTFEPLTGHRALDATDVRIRRVTDV